MIPLKWRWIIIKRLPNWYMFLATSVFLTVAMLAGALQPLLINTISASKPQPIFHGNLNQPKVAFACNVFWGEEFLPAMLDTFDQHNIKITFFIGGSWGKRYPDMLKELAKRGHELGNHSFSHPHPNSLSKRQNQEQILRTENLIQEVTGIKTTLYAPPYGEYNDTVLSAAAELGYTTIMWSVDTIDWKKPSEEVIRNRVMKKIHNGAIVLMHPTEVTAKALPVLIKEITAKGYIITTVSDIIK
ncbi:polysaccharide deacetylase family protein [Sporolituus thermophilus]|uniref:polysaccharide deacetylase family protein n=1 Tax=Sporolituus thermophilus TaxID=608505 RepID=UPI001FE1F66E|nr:polysaccharide deacetylase family protein [Sporolituus thermophilus]